jgi:recombination DNA repair RAD52 pathway protein
LANPNPLQAEAKAKRQQEIKQRVNMLFPIFSNTMKRPDIRKAVVVEYNKGLPVQDTIKRLFQAQQATQTTEAQ